MGNKSWWECWWENKILVLLSCLVDPIHVTTTQRDTTKEKKDRKKIQRFLLECTWVGIAAGEKCMVRGIVRRVRRHGWKERQRGMKEDHQTPLAQFAVHKSQVYSSSDNACNPNIISSLLSTRFSMRGVKLYALAHTTGGD